MPPPPPPPPPQPQPQPQPQPPPLVPISHIARHANLPAPSTVRVKNLAATIHAGPRDAWGRPGRPQPMAVSAAVSLAAASAASSTADAVVVGDTVHYGLLSKALLDGIVRATAASSSSSSSNSTVSAAVSLRRVLDGLWVDMTGFDTCGRGRGRVCHKAGAGAGDKGKEKEKEEAFLGAARLRALQISLRLPKATLLGDGVEITAAAAFTSRVDDEQDDNSNKHPPPPLRFVVMQHTALSLRIHRLRVPTLIGVNENERRARQVVVASVEIDGFQHDADFYPELEQVIVKTMSESSYETLEALASRITVVVAAHLTATATVAAVDHPTIPPPDDAHDAHAWLIHVSLEKPVAVPLAEAACVEMSTCTADLPKYTEAL